MSAAKTDVRLIEAGFPCHQVGAETQRERDTGKAPPTHRLHVWWARRPLTASRAAILASLLPAVTQPDTFLQHLGIEKVQAIIGVEAWTLTEEKELKRIVTEDGQEFFAVDRFAEKWLEQEQDRRRENRELIAKLIAKEASLANDAVLVRWRKESQPLPEPLPIRGAKLPIQRVAADPAFAGERIEFERRTGIRTKEDLYGYDRAFSNSSPGNYSNFVVLDPTAGGGSIPFEAMRLGCRVVANDLNPVACVILWATLDYPTRFGTALTPVIDRWGQQLMSLADVDLAPYFPDGQALPEKEFELLKLHLCGNVELATQFNGEEIKDYLYVRQVRCPHCGGEAPLLNMGWLSKKEGEEWGVKVVIDGKPKGGKVAFETYRVTGGKGPNGEDPDFATVYRGDGTCVHCKQQIDGDEIKKQARGESEYGKWIERLYCVVAVRRQPKLDKNDNLQRDSVNEIKTEKVTFFRPPNKTDLHALEKAAKRLADVREKYEADDLIPTEDIPPGHRSQERDVILLYGITRWTDMFTPRQLLCHATLIKHLKAMTPSILADLGPDRGKAVVTYLQFAIDKAVDYNSAFTRWITQRRSISGTFGRHDFSLKWTFGEMVSAGSTSGFSWALSQIVEAFGEISSLLKTTPPTVSVEILHGTAAYLATVADRSVDCICMDPPYYNNVQYAELSDFYYVWQKRTLRQFYPEIFSRRLTNKSDEAVANPHRDGGDEAADAAYLRIMREVFAECHRVLKPDGVMTLMFTHKTQEAWDALTRSLIESGWVIRAAIPVDSEFANSQNIMNTASAETSIFIACRKRLDDSKGQGTWTGFGGQGVQQQIRIEVRAAMGEFEKLRLNPVDEMVAGYGRALRVLSEHWPVLDGNEPVSPVKAMTEASRVVAQYQMSRLTGGRLKVDDLNPEAAMTMTLYGIYGLAEFPYDDARNIANSLGIPLQSRPAGYNLDGERMVGMNPDATSGRRRRATSEEAEESGYHAPLVLKGSKLRLARPDERNLNRLERPQTEWDILHGLLTEYQRGDVPVARAYLNRHADGRQDLILDLLHVWAEEMPDEKLRKEAQTLLFGLKSAQAS